MYYFGFRTTLIKGFDPLQMLTSVIWISIVNDLPQHFGHLQVHLNKL